MKTLHLNNNQSCVPNIRGTSRKLVNIKKPSLIQLIGLYNDPANKELIKVKIGLEIIDKLGVSKARSCWINKTTKLCLESLKAHFEITTASLWKPASKDDQEIFIIPEEAEELHEWITILPRVISYNDEIENFEAMEVLFPLYCYIRKMSTRVHVCHGGIDFVQSLKNQA
jgi:hypothetical protein